MSEANGETMSAPFDQQFMDQIDDEVLKHCPRLRDDPEFEDLNYLQNAFTDWFAGWDAATEVAARISAERQATVPPTDEELGHIAYRAMQQGELTPWDQFREAGWLTVTKTTAADYIRIGAAVRQALGAWPQVPTDGQMAFEHSRLMRFARAFAVTHDTRADDLPRWQLGNEQNHELWDAWRDVEFQVEHASDQIGGAE